MAGDLRCNCATFGNARTCPVHTQADYEAAGRPAAGDLRGQLILILRTVRPVGADQAEVVDVELLPLIEAYAVKRAEAMRERCAEAIEATTESGSPALRQWAAEIVRAVPVNGEGVRDE